MNKEKLLKFADWLEANPQTDFDINNIHKCAMSLLHKVFPEANPAYSVTSTLDILEIEDYQLVVLFGTTSENNIRITGYLPYKGVPDDQQLVVRNIRRMVAYE